MNYLKLIRPINLLVIIGTMCLFWYSFLVANGYKIFRLLPLMTNFQFFLLVFSTVCIAAGGYIINDIYDADIDTFNRPNRVIVGQKISETTAYNFYKLTCLISVIATLTLAYLTKEYRLSTFPIIIMVVLFFYASMFKKQLILGNLTVAFCSAFTILLISLFESGGNYLMGPNETAYRSSIFIGALVYSLFAFLTTFIREIVKDIEDKAGDEQYDCKTIPIQFGDLTAKIVCSVFAFIIVSMLLTFVFFFIKMDIEKVPLFIILLLILPLVLIIGYLFIAKTVKQMHIVSNLIKIYMVLGIASMLYFSNGLSPILINYVAYLKQLF
ncbi:MAG TPA: geranylgeranylglycerol-phosphate geranylgeranyltransferase [Chitinophagales bacterium]|nr:geranylgeranylglycerol-phosphate geranylgeranyltransferase [Chitinophagales bacterium]